MFSLVHHGHSRPTIITLPVLEGCCVFRVCVSVCQLVLGCGDLHLALSQSLWQCLCLPVVLDHTVTTSIIRRPAFSPSAPCSLFVFALCPCWLCAPSCPSCPLSCAFRGVFVQVLRGVFVQVHPCAAPFFVVPVGSVAPSWRGDSLPWHCLCHQLMEAFFFQLSGWRAFPPALWLAQLSRPPHVGGPGMRSAPRSFCRSPRPANSLRVLPRPSQCALAPIVSFVIRHQLPRRCQHATSM